MVRPSPEVSLRCILAAALVLLVACVNPDAPLHPGDTTEVEIEVPPGATAGRLGPLLEGHGLLRGDLRWRLYLRGNPEEATCLKAGRFLLRRDMSMREIMATLCGPPLSEDIPFTVLEGWRIREIDAALAAAGWAEPGEYTRLAESKDLDLPFDVPSPNLEGYLFPETYQIDPREFSTESFIRRQVRTFERRFLSRHAEAVAERGLHAVVVMASMLEREEPVRSMRPIVAGILWKRLDHEWKLGVDATSRYTLEQWNDRRAFLRQLRDPADPYNTRLRGGLPPTAIGNASLPSLEAAIQPEPSEYWYYLHDGTGRFHGGRNADEHEANRARYNVY